MLDNTGVKTVHGNMDDMIPFFKVLRNGIGNLLPMGQVMGGNNFFPFLPGKLTADFGKQSAMTGRTVAINKQAGDGGEEERGL